MSGEFYRMQHENSFGKHFLQYVRSEDQVKTSNVEFETQR